jgi:hypothetical protein
MCKRYRFNYPLFKTAFPEFKIRHDAIGEDGNRWVHIEKWTPPIGHYLSKLRV